MLQSLRGFMLLSFIGNVNAESKVVSMQAKRMPHGDSLEKRDASAVDFGNLDHLAYYVSGSLGTPGQEIWFVVNTLLSDTWVLDPELATGAASSKMGSFDVEKSDTYKFAEGSNSTLVTDKVEIDWFTDDLRLSDLEIPEAPLGLVVQAEKRLNSMGLGFLSLRENSTNGIAPPSILDRMVEAEVIKSRTSSIWLDSKESDEGSIIFGGFDSAEIDGLLWLIEIQPPQNAYAVPLLDITMTDNATSATSLGFEEPLPAVIDMSIPFMSLPEDKFNQTAYYFGASKTGSEAWAVPCSVGDSEGNFTFQLGSDPWPRVHVPFSELAIPPTEELFFEDGASKCLFSFQPSSIDEGAIVLGQSSLRSAYVVFLIDSMMVGIADANWDVAKDKTIVEVVQGSSVESATQATGVTVTVTASITKDVPAYPTITGNATNAGEPGSAAKSLESGIKTTLSEAEHHTGKSNAAPTSTESASASSSSSAAAAPATFEQSTFPVVSLSVCGVIMLIVGMAI